jgi:hypothetical protein
VLLVGGALATAAALLLLRLHFQPPTVPRYELTGAAVSGERGLELQRGGHFSMVLHPTGPVTGAVGARAFLVHDEVVRPWEVPVVVDRDGSVRLAGNVDAIFAGVPAGPWEVAVAVGRPENLPTAPRDILRARDGADDAGAAAWHLVRERVWLGP